MRICKIDREEGFWWEMQVAEETPSIICRCNMSRNELRDCCLWRDLEADAIRIRIVKIWNVSKFWKSTLVKPLCKSNTEETVGTRVPFICICWDSRNNVESSKRKQEFHMLIRYLYSNSNFSAWPSKKWITSTTFRSKSVCKRMYQSEVIPKLRNHVWRECDRV